MNKNLVTVCLLALAVAVVPCRADVKGKIDGKKEFQQHCAVCHANGGNIVNPKKTLKKADLAANGIKSWQDIVKVMRHPGPGMTPFPPKDIGDAEARAIAEYVQKAFK
jgi:cytochrome c6